MEVQPATATDSIAGTPAADTRTNPAGSIPALGFGTFNNFDGSPATNEDPVLKGAVLAALAAGYRHFDCAEFYANEATIGAALQEGGVPRSELFLVSKAWNNHRTADALLASVKATLQALQVWPLRERENEEERRRDIF